jgi:hypothetical protein
LACGEFGGGGVDFGFGEGESSGAPEAGFGCEPGRAHGHACRVDEVVLTLSSYLCWSDGAEAAEFGVSCWVSCSSWAWRDDDSR